MTNPIEVSDLTLMYAAHGGTASFTAVTGLSFQVQPGEVLALLGESGAGKSTLLQTLAGRAQLGAKTSRIKITGGSVTVLDTVLNNLGKRAARQLSQQIAFVSQRANSELPSDLKIADILTQNAKARSKNIDNAWLAERISEMFEILELPLAMLSNFPAELSKGQRQRVAIAAELVTPVKLIIADEVTNGVDALVRPQITKLLTWHREQTGAAMVLVSHDIQLLETLADKALVLRAGQAVGYDSLNSVFRDVKHSYVAELADALRRTAYDEAAAKKAADPHQTA